MAHVRTDDDGVPFRIPDSVTLEELTVALEPLCELLNITINHIFDVPGIQIGFRSVTFVAVAPQSAEDWAADHPASNVTELGLQNHLEGFGELAQVVSVKVLIGDESDGVSR